MGRPFEKTVAVPQGKVQALWMGVQVPEAAAPATTRARSRSRPPACRRRAPRSRSPSRNRIIPAAGDNEPARHSRLRWLDSTLAFDDDVVAPYTPVQVRDNAVSVLGRTVVVGRDGFPERIQSRFAQEMTSIGEKPRDVLAGPDPPRRRGRRRPTARRGRPPASGS